MKYTPKIQQAIEAAAKAHLGQKRKGSNVPYFTHPMAVAYIVSEYTSNEDAICAALLHDTLEDTKYSASTLLRDFGARIFFIVQALTKDSSISDWEKRYESYLSKLFETRDMDVALVCIADKLHNLQCLIHDYAIYGNSMLAQFHGDQLKKNRRTMSFLVCTPLGQSHPLIDKYGELIKQLDAILKI